MSVFGVFLVCIFPHSHFPCILSTNWLSIFDHSVGLALKGLKVSFRAYFFGNYVCKKEEKSSFTLIKRFQDDQPVHGKNFHNFSLISQTKKNFFSEQKHLIKLLKSRKLTNIYFRKALNVIRELTPSCI